MPYADILHTIYDGRKIMNYDNIKKYKVGVLAGGLSSEREISLKSGKAVLNALIEKGITPQFIDIKDEKNWQNNLDIDVAFIALHGAFGEDGTVQKILENKGIVYTGSGPEASAIALDKVASKLRFQKTGVLTPEFKVLKKGKEVSSRGVVFPCVVKPSYEGSSIGLTIVESIEKFEEAVMHAFKYSNDVLVEEFIPGKELTVGILDNKALPVVEIVPDGTHYDFNAKYNSKGTKYIVPAELTDADRGIVQEMGLKAHMALGCEGFSRVDVRLRGDGKAYVLEVNTIPGMTERSLLPMAAKASGLVFPDLCLKILADTLKGKRNLGGRE